MESRSGIYVRNKTIELDLVNRSQFTRRALGGVLLGGLASVGIGLAERARGEPVIPTAEPDAPDHLPRRRIKVLDKIGRAHV